MAHRHDHHRGGRLNPEKEKRYIFCGEIDLGNFVSFARCDGVVMEQEVSDLVSVKLLLATIRHGKKITNLHFLTGSQETVRKLHIFPLARNLISRTFTNKNRGIQNLGVGDNLPVTLVDKRKHTNKCYNVHIYSCGKTWGARKNHMQRFPVFAIAFVLIGGVTYSISHSKVSFGSWVATHDFPRLQRAEF